MGERAAGYDSQTKNIKERKEDEELMIRVYDRGVEEEFRNLLELEDLFILTCAFAVMPLSDLV